MINAKGIALITHFEGLHDGDLSEIGLQPKMCPAGIWTVGYGHALRDNNGKFLKGIDNKAAAYKIAPALTLKQAEDLLQQDLHVFEEGVNNLVSVELTDNELAALVSLAYNIGLGNLAKSTLLLLLNKCQYKSAAEQFLVWDKCGGKPLRGLTLRRQAERNLFLEA